MARKESRRSKRRADRKAGMNVDYSGVKKSTDRLDRILLIVFIIVLIFVVVRGSISYISLKSEQKAVEAEYKQLVAEKEELETTLKYIDNPEYIEQAARDMLKMVMPGEKLIIMKDENGNSDSKIVKNKDEDQAAEDSDSSDDSAEEESGEDGDSAD